MRELLSPDHSWAIASNCRAECRAAEAPLKETLLIINFPQRSATAS